VTTPDLIEMEAIDMAGEKLTRRDLQQMTHGGGQLRIFSGPAGAFQAFTPKFVKKYENLAKKPSWRFQLMLTT